MQTPVIRYIVLIGILLLGAATYAVMGAPRGVGTARWPGEDTFTTVQGWSVGAQQPTEGGFVSRTFRDAAGSAATLSIFSNQSPKLYEAGAEVPFLGNGYKVDAPPADLVAMLGPDIGSLLADQEGEHWLVIYAYGERRGLLGNGPKAWTFALLDGLMGFPNDYYKMFVDARIASPDSEFAHDVAHLARQVFPRIAAYYAT